MSRHADGTFSFYVPYESKFDYRDNIVYYVDMDDVKRELGWSNIHKRTGYFEEILKKYDNIAGYWSVLDWGESDPPDYMWRRMCGMGSVVKFLEIYAAEMPDKIKNKKEYWERAQAALVWAARVRKEEEERNDGY